MSVIAILICLFLSLIGGFLLAFWQMSGSAWLHNSHSGTVWFHIYSSVKIFFEKKKNHKSTPIHQVKNP